MSGIAELVKLLKGQADKKAAEAQKAAPRNPNAERFAFLHNTEAAAEGNSREVEKPRAVAELEKNHGKGVLAGRILRAVACSQRYFKGEDPSTAAIKVIHNVYKDRETAKYLESCIEKDMSAGIPSEGGYLIPEVVNDQVVELLYPKVTVLQMGATEVPMVNGNLTLNYISEGTTADYIGENDAATNSTGAKISQASWRSKKLISLIPISNDLLKVASAQADRIVLRDAVKQMAIRMNKAAFQDDGSNNTPRGLQFETGLTDVTISGLFTSDSPTEFFVQLEDALIDLESMDKPGWCFSHRFWAYLKKLKDLNGQYYYKDTGRSYANASGNASGYSDQMFEGYQKRTTQLIPSTGSSNPFTTNVFFGDWAEFWIPRQGMLEVDSSSEAAYNTGPSTVVSAYGKDQTVLRLIDRHDMGMRQKKAMARSSVTYNQ